MTIPNWDLQDLLENAWNKGFNAAKRYRDIEEHLIHREIQDECYTDSYNLICDYRKKQDKLLHLYNQSLL